MDAPLVYTLTNPGNGDLAFKIYDLRNANPFDHLQRLSYYTVVLLTEGHARLHADVAEYEVAAGNIYEEPLIRLSISEGQEFSRLLEEMKPEIIHNGAARHELLVSYLKIFLIKASRLKMASATQHTDHRPQAAIAQQLRDAIEEHYRKLHSPGEYAVLLHVTPKVLATAAKTYFSKTLTALISERIIIEAKRDLYLSSKTVKEIAYVLGFEDEFYFSRWFKNNASISPQFFRETVGFARAEASSVRIEVQ